MKTITLLQFMQDAQKRGETTATYYGAAIMCQYSAAEFKKVLADAGVTCRSVVVSWVSYEKTPAEWRMDEGVGATKIEVTF